MTFWARPALLCFKVMRCLCLLLLTTVALAQSGWEFSSAQPNDYASLVERDNPHGGARCASLRAVGSPGAGAFAVLSQHLPATAFRGWRVRLSGWLRCQNVTGWAGLWLRVDASHGPPLAFDNMRDRPVRGTQRWSLYSVELDVPAAASELHFGALLAGGGQVWLDDVLLERLRPALPGSAERARVRGEQPQPVNPGFEEP